MTKEKLTIAWDMDNTLCTHIWRHHPEDILKVKPKRSQFRDKLYIDILRELKEKGYETIIFTRRDVVKNGRKLTKQWLKKYNVPYDKLITHKPHYDLLIDDRVFSTHQLLNANIIESRLHYARRELKKHTYRPRRKKKWQK